MNARTFGLLLSGHGAIAIAGCGESRVDVARLAPPQTIHAWSPGSTVELYWSAVPGARYAIYVQEGPGVTRGATRREEGESALHIGSEQFYRPCIRVAALSAGEESELSPEVCAVPQPYAIARDPAATFDQTQEDAAAGTSIALGDVNGDGFLDLAIGSPFFDDGLNVDAGRVAVHLGGPLGISPLPAWDIRGEDAGNHAGTAVAFIDYDGDGFDDLFFGEPGYSNGRGAVVGVRSNPLTLFDEVLTWVYVGTDAGDRLGTSIAATEDAFDSVVVAGAPGGGGGMGGIEAYTASTGLVFQHAGTTPGGELGTSVSVLDLGFAAGAPGADEVVVIYTDATTETIAAESAGARFGTHVVLTQTSAGTPALLVAAPLYGDDRGAVHYYVRSGDEFVSRYDWGGNGQGDGRGLAMIAADDLTRNDHPEVLYSDARGDIGWCDMHEASLNCYYALVEGSPARRFGAAMAVGDVDGDGLLDLLVSTPDSPAGEPAVSIFMGASGYGPEASAGSSLQSYIWEVVHPLGAGFVAHQPDLRHACTWEWGDGAETVLDPCTPATAAAATHVYTDPGTFEMRLTVTANGRSGQSATFVYIGGE